MTLAHGEDWGVDGPGMALTEARRVPGPRRLVAIQPLPGGSVQARSCPA